ncbi:hypothetical protein EJ110_NYTH08739 [Nymphaea thermarum]|nr:hypothetical protein EJ110_NYTH08739 [Nymphaea thermarum]
MVQPEANVPFLDNGRTSDAPLSVQRTLVESKKLWRSAGPAVFSRLAMYGMNVVTQAFVGHLGDLELAAVSIASTVIVGLNLGLMLGMASGLQTLCGQAFGAERHYMLGIYLQRSFIVMFMYAVLMLPLYIFATPILKLVGQTDAIAELAGSLALWFIPQQFAFVFLFPLQRFLQCQLNNIIIVWVTAIAFTVHCVLSWLLIYHLNFGLVGAAVSLNIGWWLPAIGLFLYMHEYQQLGNNDSSSILGSNRHIPLSISIDLETFCLLMMWVNDWRRVRVSNELGAGNARGAKFASIVSVATSAAIGLFFWILIITLHNEFALLFTSSTAVIHAVSNLSILLAFTILLNSVQPVLSGVAVGSGWQALVAYINIGCYYFVGLPVGAVLCWVFDHGLLGLWSGMIGGTVVQTLILTTLVIRCDWEKEVDSSLFLLRHVVLHRFTCWLTF